jgi:hypothetical protein
MSPFPPWARIRRSSAAHFEKPRPPAGANFLEMVFTSPKLLRTVAGIFFQIRISSVGAN